MPRRSWFLALALASALAASACGYDDSPYAADDAGPTDPGAPPAPEPAPTPVTCTLAVECDDADACTTDTCDAGLCRNTPIVGCVVPATP
jgi:hypothetical protein